LRVTRGLERCTSDFEMTVSERWGLEEDVWQIAPGDSCEVLFEGETVLTGWVDAYRPGYGPNEHSIRISGRSKTCDFVDSSVLVEGGQFTGMTPGQIAEFLAQPFGLQVVIEHDGEPEAEVQVQQGETCFALVERLSRLQELLVTDDPQGRLVLTRAGAGQSSTALRHGENILRASADLDNSRRFSEYIVKAQRPGNSKKSDDDAEAPSQDWWQPSLLRLRSIPNVSDRYAERMALMRRGGGKKNPKTLTQVIGTVRDPDITRYRPHLIVCEKQSDDAEATKRAQWEMRRRLAKAIRATITVNGWRQQDGRLWLTNEMAQCEAPWLALNRELIIAQVQYEYGPGGEMTALELTLPDAFLPEAKRKAKRRKEGEGKKGRKKGRKGGDAPNYWISTAGES
jgi:prophage tail gpP-like protein